MEISDVEKASIIPTFLVDQLPTCRYLLANSKLTEQFDFLLVGLKRFFLTFALVNSSLLGESVNG